MGAKWNPDEKKLKLIDAVGELLAEKGHEGLTANKIAARAGVSKPMIYQYFGNLNGLLKAYIGREDSWVAYFETLDVPEAPTVGELQSLFTRMMQEMFCYFHDNKEMQRLILWQVNSYNPLMRATCEAREKAGLRLLRLTDEHFRNSGINFKSVIAMLVGGVYFNVLHDSAAVGTMAGQNLKVEKDFEDMKRTIAQIIDWAFRDAGNH